ncbi:MAG: thiol reductant ABC exporter subunit CydD [Streptococcaceae bacterium]|jgi:ATP-binding cassette subfamily C protein CydD|nr:thiol reductant ABC exporter subunit CydD [Streptococcaceae bacterium]
MIDKSLLELPGVRKLFPLLGLLAFFQAVAIAGQALFLAATLTGLWERKTMSQMAYSAFAFFAFFMLRELVNFIRQKILDKFAYHLAQELRENLLKKIFKLGPSAIEELGTGTTAATVISGIDLVENYIKLVLSKVLNMMLIPVFIWLVVVVLDWRSAIILLITFPLAIVFMILLGYTAQARAARQYESFQLLSNHFLDSLRGIATLKYFGKSKAYANSIHKTSEEFRTATMATLRLAMLNNFALDFFATLSIASVALFLGLRLMDSHILLFPALATLILAPEYFLPLREFASDYHATLNGKNALASINDVMALDENIFSELPEKVKWSEDSELKLKQLSKLYENERGVKDINISLKGYQKIALVGASGSGKSTLLSMLAGFLTPSSGSLELNSQILSSLTENKWRESLLFIPQQSYIFSASLRDNIRFYEPNATDEEVNTALQLAGLKELDLSLDDQIGAGGRTLSGGQMQRIALSRAFLSKDRSILCLDEPTAHLDIETELEIKENILPLLENKLVFLATHRLHWLPEMDLVILLDEGEVRGIGSHEELKATNHYYRELLEEMS